MKRVLTTSLVIILFALLGFIGFLAGIVLFRPIPPAVIDIFWRIVICIIWSLVGILACRLIGNRHAAWLLILPFTVMGLHIRGAYVLLFESIKVYIYQDTNLFPVIAFLSAIIVQICMVIELKKHW